MRSQSPSAGLNFIPDQPFVLSLLLFKSLNLAGLLQYLAANFGGHILYFPSTVLLIDNSTAHRQASANAKACTGRHLQGCCQAAVNKPYLVCFGSIIDNSTAHRQASANAKACTGRHLQGCCQAAVNKPYLVCFGSMHVLVHESPAGKPAGPSRPAKQSGTLSMYS